MEIRMICQDLNAQLGLLPGDCIVAAGMVSYVWGTQQRPMGYAVGCGYHN
jgi:hypothetical protein